MYFFLESSFEVCRLKGSPLYQFLETSALWKPVLCLVATRLVNADCLQLVYAVLGASSIAEEMANVAVLHDIFLAFNS